jgi:hypothetical protein
MHGELDNVPFGMHAVVPAQPELGLLPGVIFALKNIHHSVNINQQNWLHPFYLVYIGDDGQIVADHTEVKRLLDLIRTSSKGRVEPIRDVCRIFNERTEDGRKMGRYSDLFSSAIRSMIEVNEEKYMPVQRRADYGAEPHHQGAGRFRTDRLPRH